MYTDVVMCSAMPAWSGYKLFLFVAYSYNLIWFNNEASIAPIVKENCIFKISRLDKDWYGKFIHLVGLNT